MGVAEAEPSPICKMALGTVVVDLERQEISVIVIAPNNPRLIRVEVAVEPSPPNAPQVDEATLNPKEEVATMT